MESAAAERLDYVDASMNYLDPAETAPKSHITPPAPGAAVSRPKIQDRPVRIHDARSVADELSLDAEGMAIEHHDSAVTNFYDADEVKRVYYPEVVDLVKRATGATKVVVFDHNVRNETRANAGTDGARQPVQFVHNDYTEKSGPQRVRDLLDPAEAEAMLKHRFAMINVWRPIRGPVQDTPLAVCDAQSMGPEDFVPTDLIYEDRTGEVFSVRHSADHQWYYVSDMQADEVMYLKCYDSERDGRARFTAHSAFRNPASPAGAQPRESIEARTLVFFAPDA